MSAYPPWTARSRAPPPSCWLEAQVPYSSVLSDFHRSHSLCYSLDACYNIFAGDVDWLGGVE